MSKKFSLILILLIVAITTSGLFFVYYKKINNKQADTTNGTSDQDKLFLSLDPSSLGWVQEALTAPWQGRDSHAVVVYKNKIWLMGGLDGTKRLISPGNVDYGNAEHFSDVWFSEDGKSWQLASSNAPWGQRRSMQVVEFKGEMWLMGGWGPELGYKNNIWSSKDGVNWALKSSSAEWPAREGHQLVVFKDKMWLIGGVKYTGQKLFNDVWFSEDGINWQQATKNAGWDPRWDFSSTVFNDKLWVVGGMAFGDKLFNDVWSSEDGIVWRLVDKNPPFGLRQGSSLIDYAGKLWTLGRLNIPLYGHGLNDVWYSEDGITWKKTKENPAWTGREDAGAVVFKNRIWVLGGMDKNWQWKNDVWSSTSNLDRTN